VGKKNKHKLVGFNGAFSRPRLPDGQGCVKGGPSERLVQSPSEKEKDETVAINAKCFYVREEETPLIREFPRAELERKKCGQTRGGKWREVLKHCPLGQ